MVSSQVIRKWPFLRVQSQYTDGLHWLARTLYPWRKSQLCNDLLCIFLLVTKHYLFLCSLPIFRINLSFKPALCRIAKEILKLFNIISHFPLILNIIYKVCQVLFFGENYFPMRETGSTSISVTKSLLNETCFSDGDFSSAIPNRSSILRCEEKE